MGCGVYWQQINELEKAMKTMGRFGIEESDPAYKALLTKRGALMAEVGRKFPREITPMSEEMVFLSPAIRLWHDVESGWMSEARERPGAPPVYHYVKDEVAMAILKKEVTPELEQVLLTRDDYIGE
jgi:hypothetical protein